MDAYPYMISNNKIADILENIRSAAKPNKFNKELLDKMGFTSSNDRAIIPLLRRLGFLTEDNTPTPYYDELRDPTRYQFVLAERIKHLYQDLYQVKTTIHSATDSEIKGAFSRITGKDEGTVMRFFNTFKALTVQANFTGQPAVPDMLPPVVDSIIPNKQDNSNSSEKATPQFHYNIQIHLPATTEISVYNAIFKSLRENLINE